MEKYRKRTFKNLKGFAEGLSFPVRNMARLKGIRSISPAFRERLMLAVTAVNGCRYCSYFHAGQALKSGISSAELNRMLSGDIADCPEDEAAAVLYAQHWAESDARPDSEAVIRLEQAYGAQKTQAIDSVLQLIRFANLLGNSLDYVIYRLSFGRWGG